MTGVSQLLPVPDVVVHLCLLLFELGENESSLCENISTQLSTCGKQLEERERGEGERRGEGGGGDYTHVCTTSESLDTTFFTTAGKRSAQSLPLAIICNRTHNSHFPGCTSLYCRIKYQPRLFSFQIIRKRCNILSMYIIPAMKWDLYHFLFTLFIIIHLIDHECRGLHQ